MRAGGLLAAIWWLPTNFGRLWFGLLFWGGVAGREPLFRGWSLATEEISPPKAVLDTPQFGSKYTDSHCFAVIQWDLPMNWCIALPVANPPLTKDKLG